MRRFMVRELWTLVPGPGRGQDLRVACRRGWPAPCLAPMRRARRLRPWTTPGLTLGLAIFAPEGAAAATEDAAHPDPTTTSEPIQPPRVDGWYLGGIALGTAAWTRVHGLATPHPFAGGVGGARIGQIVLPWLGVGVQLLGGYSYSRNTGNRQRLGQGALLIDLALFPISPRPFTIRGSLGFGGGAVREDGTPGRSGMGGASFGLAVGYAFFPTASRKRPKRGGGWSIGPELGVLAMTPAARGRPMANTLYLGLVTVMYFGE